MVWAPMSEIPQIGRNPIYIGTLVVFVFFQFAVIYAKNFGMLLAFRFLTGLFGSPVLATGGASLGDMYKPAKRGKSAQNSLFPLYLKTERLGLLQERFIFFSFFTPHYFCVSQC